MINNIWFIGTGEFAALCLGALSKDLTFTHIITGEPTRSGRNGKENPSSVEIHAKKLGLSITRTGPLSKNQELFYELERNTPELIFVIDFGQIIREPFLNKPDFGCWNIHPSLLPRWRGAAPIQRALMNGDSEIGVSVFRLVREMDAGPIIAQAAFEIGPEDGASEFYKALADAGSALAVKAVRKAPDIKFTEQNNKLATYAHKLEKNEFEISFASSADNIINTVRALGMSGGAFVRISGNKRLKLWRVSEREVSGKAPGQVLNLDTNPVIACLDFAVELLEVQAEGKRRTTGQEWARGARFQTGDVI